MIEKFKVAMTKVAIFAWLSLAILIGGCSVQHPDPAAYAAVKETCLKQDQVLYVFVNVGHVKVECVKP